jgi:hypothetical protein
VIHCSACQGLELLERLTVAVEALSQNYALSLFRRASWLVAEPQGENDPRHPSEFSMPAQVTMTTKQKAAAALALLDADGQALPGLPAGAVSSFPSSNPAVSSFSVDSSGLAGEVNSGEIGTARIIGRVTLADGRILEDTLDVTILPTAPERVAFSVGSPVLE